MSLNTLRHQLSLADPPTILAHASACPQPRRMHPCTACAIQYGMCHMSTWMTLLSTPQSSAPCSPRAALVISQTPALDGKPRHMMNCCPSTHPSQQHQPRCPVHTGHAWSASRVVPACQLLPSRQTSDTYVLAGCTAGATGSGGASGADDFAAGVPGRGAASAFGLGYAKPLAAGACSRRS